MLLPRSEELEEVEGDPRAELIRRLQEYERYKKAAEEISEMPRMERELHQASAEVVERKVEVKLPDLTMKELLLAFKDVLSRAEMFAHHRIQREPLSTRQRMSEILVILTTESFTEFKDLFDPKEGRMGIAVTFIALLELLREQLIELVQTDAYSPIHVRAANSAESGSASDDNQTAESIRCDHPCCP